MISKVNRRLLDKILLAKNHIDNGYPKFAKLFLDQAIDTIIEREKNNSSSDVKSKSSQNGRNRKTSHLKKVI